jgi:hypothetical protein
MWPKTVNRALMIFLSGMLFCDMSETLRTAHGADEAGGRQNDDERKWNARRIERDGCRMY